MRNRPFLLYVIGIAFFCMMDASMKQLVASNSALMATFWRYGMAILFTLGFWVQAGRPGITREMLPIHALRGCVIAVSAWLFFWALGVLPLAQVVTISFIAPLLVPPLASLILKEKLQAGSVISGLAGFLGVLIAVGLRPENWSASLPGVLATLMAAASYALSVVLMRMRASRDGPAIVSLLGAAIPMLALFPFVLLFVPPAQILPQPKDWPLFILTGLFGAVALQFIARAYARAEAQILAPFEYTALGWAALFGWIFFAEPVPLRTWIGAAVIAAACLWQTRAAAKIPRQPD